MKKKEKSKRNRRKRKRKRRKKEKLKSKHCMVDLDRAPSNQAIDSLVVLDDFPPSPPIYPLCCTRVGGPPEFEPLDDRRMEWSPLHPSRVCRSCGASTSLLDLRWMQHRALCVPLHLPSCLTDPLAVQCVSAPPVSVWFRTILQLPIQWYPLHHPVLTRPIGSRMVLFRVSIHCMGGVRAAPVLQDLGRSPGSSVH